ncbi:C40 family peptidase [Hufsiella ginkgonis]|uniref:Peptidoglycan endopeptidase n=1 Tax=Hufsiella ginkgonis TaxID=2695274 RepID=A0A7K1XY79_9SPHI|nr:C40 family peptidase [Hufsiella ginkgonis]MXV15699.1 peptidoglycan endopeptidase [Hufsiella ginkgonis]
MHKIMILCGLPVVLFACGSAPEQYPVKIEAANQVKTDSLTQPVSVINPEGEINTGTTDPGKLVAYALTLKGTPYKYASADPASGFDCSGFITYVFNHFGISVPRSSVDFTQQGKPTELRLAKPGDLILFTGTDSTIRTVGHMGIITRSGDSTVFVHSTSGKAYGVTETTLNPYYMGRFVKVIRIFKE